MTTAIPPETANESKAARGIIALLAVLTVNAAFMFWMLAPPSVLPYMGWYVDIYGPAAVFLLLLAALAIGWATGFLPRRAWTVRLAAGIVLAELALMVAGTLWLLSALSTVASM